MVQYSTVVQQKRESSPWPQSELFCVPTPQYTKTPTKFVTATVEEKSSEPMAEEAIVASQLALPTAFVAATAG